MAYALRAPRMNSIETPPPRATARPGRRKAFTVGLGMRAAQRPPRVTLRTAQTPRHQRTHRTAGEPNPGTSLRRCRAPSVGTRPDPAYRRKVDVSCEGGPPILARWNTRAGNIQCRLAANGRAALGQEAHRAPGSGLGGTPTRPPCPVCHVRRVHADRPRSRAKRAQGGLRRSAPPCQSHPANARPRGRGGHEARSARLRHSPAHRPPGRPKRRPCGCGGTSGYG